MIKNVNVLLKEINKDVKVKKNVSANSDAFTFFCKKDKCFLYRKIVINDLLNANKLKQQLEWIITNSNQLSLPQIKNFVNKNQTFWYDMITNKNCINMYEHIKKKSIISSWRVIFNVLKEIKSLHTKNTYITKEDLMIKYLNCKVYKNLDKIKSDSKYIKSLLDYDEIIINGKQYKNLNYYLKNSSCLSNNNLLKTFKNDTCGCIHGDLTLENIIFDKKYKKKFYFIDPNIDNIHQTIFLDYSKLLQSLHGQYEKLKEVKQIKLSHNKINYKLNVDKKMEKIYNLYDRYLQKNFSYNDYKSIYYHEIIHWLRLLPYKIRKDDKIATVYYCQTLILLNDLEKKFTNL